MTTRSVQLSRLTALALAVCGCHGQPERNLPHVPEGTDARPSVVLVAMPEPGQETARAFAAARAEWSGLEEEALSLREPARHPQPRLPAAFRARGLTALRDLVEPLAGVTAFAPTRASDIADDARTLVVVEMLPGETIQALHGSDAFTESYYELDTYGIRRAVIRLPLWLLDKSPMTSRTSSSTNSATRSASRGISRTVSTSRGRPGSGTGS